MAQPLELDLTVWLSLRRVGESDSPDALLDYRHLYKMVSDTVGTSPHKLLEALCERIAGKARKPHVPIDGPLDYVEVVVERHEEDADG